MIKYKNVNGNSNVESFELGEDFILVKFNKTVKIYSYSYNKAGVSNVEEMKRLAMQGYGLNSFINRNVKFLYD